MRVIDPLLIRKHHSRTHPFRRFRSRSLHFRMLQRIFRYLRRIESSPPLRRSPNTRTLTRTPIPYDLLHRILRTLAAIQTTCQDGMRASHLPAVRCCQSQAKGYGVSLRHGSAFMTEKDNRKLADCLTNVEKYAREAMENGTFFSIHPFAFAIRRLINLRYAQTLTIHELSAQDSVTLRQLAHVLLKNWPAAAEPPIHPVRSKSLELHRRLLGQLLSGLLTVSPHHSSPASGVKCRYHRSCLSSSLSSDSACNHRSGQTRHRHHQFSRRLLRVTRLTEIRQHRQRRSPTPPILSRGRSKSNITFSIVNNTDLHRGPRP